MGKMFRISNDFSYGASGPILLKFHMEPPYMVKTFKQLQNLGCLGAESLLKSLETGGSTKVAKIMVVH